MFSGLKISFGITGGISAYKAADVVSWLKKQGADVQVIMTAGAREFITPLVMKTLSEKPVATDLMSLDSDFHVPHIDGAQCDLFIILPATANFLAKAAHGLADDILSATVLATTAPVLCAPAMNNHMYENPATQHNLSLLTQRGWSMIEPGIGRLACGTIGQGRLADLDVIQKAIITQIGRSKHLQGKRVLLTAGPTYEYIDPVRFIGNRSSGKMGYSIALAARNAGAEVTMVLGPSALPDAAGINTVRVTSAQEMYDAAWSFYPQADIVVCAAAVADYRPAEKATQKIKKSGDEQLHLVRNPDILASFGADKGQRFLVGFAAETCNEEQFAREKLEKKNLDLMVMNNVAAEGAGFDVDTNIVTLMWPAGSEVCMEELPLMNKDIVAEKIVSTIVQLACLDN